MLECQTLLPLDNKIKHVSRNKVYTIFYGDILIASCQNLSNANMKIRALRKFESFKIEEFNVFHDYITTFDILKKHFGVTKLIPNQSRVGS